jgi:hypothetical protein
VKRVCWLPRLDQRSTFLAIPAARRNSMAVLAPQRPRYGSERRIINRKQRRISNHPAAGEKNTNSGRSPLREFCVSTFAMGLNPENEHYDQIVRKQTDNRFPHPGRAAFVEATDGNHSKAHLLLKIPDDPEVWKYHNEDSGMEHHHSIGSERLSHQQTQRITTLTAKPAAAITIAILITVLIRANGRQRDTDFLPLATNVSGLPTI